MPNQCGHLEVKSGIVLEWTSLAKIPTAQNAKVPVPILDRVTRQKARTVKAIAIVLPKMCLR